MDHFSVAQTAEILDLPPSIVDKLVRSGQLPSTDGSVPAARIQSYLSQSLIRLFQAQATAVTQGAPAADAIEMVVEAPKSAPVAETLITRSIAEYESEKRVADAPELRIAPRYVPRRQLGGTYRQTRITVLQISLTGLRIRHEEPLRPGDIARLTLALLKPGRSFAMQARVVWTSIASRGDGPSFCISGLRALDAGPLNEVIQHLRDARELQPETSRRRSTAVNPGAISGLTDEDVASIIRAVRKFSSDPVEAGRWYTRARFALADEQIRAAAPPRGRDREEVVGVWEYLDRRLELPKVASVMNWLRQTRACAAETAQAV